MPAKKKKAAAAGKSGGASRHKEIDEQTTDPFERAARVQTSNDGKFSTYEIAPKNDPRDGDLILQYRGEPKKTE
jgi:hypothetical protein